ncbi:hypothetical protein BH20CHL1_BH20CHL1_06320 [soil metagenome]
MVALPAIVTPVTLLMGVLTVRLYRTYDMSDQPQLPAPQGVPFISGRS